MPNNLNKLSGVFTNGGAKPNIIPEEAALQYYVRAPKMVELKVLKEKIISCFEGAAKATGCQVSRRKQNTLKKSVLDLDFRVDISRAARPLILEPKKSVCNVACL